MPLSLHAAFVPTTLQILGASLGWLDKAAASGIAESELVEARLIEDMLPFAYQVKSCAVHSQGAIEGLRQGVFSPDMTEPPQTLSGLRERVEGAIAFLEGVSEDELEGMIGQPMRFEFGDFRLDFTAESFLLSFSQPNFFFHATTAYDLLRMKGIEIGKRDFVGQTRILDISKAG